MRILTVEDDELLAQSVARVLTQQHYAVDIALDGEAGWQSAIATDYDLILLDVMLPKLDGISLCRQLRQKGYQMPILLLTAKDSCSDQVNGLDAGADDYVIKPVNFNQLTARIRAVLRRACMVSSPLLTWAALSLDPRSLEVVYHDQPLHLTATEYRLLELFLRNPQRVFSRSAIVEHLWTFDNQPEASTVKTYIKNLRQKLKAAGASTDLIETVYGLGYRLSADPTAGDASELSSPDPAVETHSKEQQLLRAVTRARNRFKTQLSDRLRSLYQAIEPLDANTETANQKQQALHEAHRFAGALGTFGFTTAAQWAEAIEDRLQIQPFDCNQIQQIRQLMKALAQELELSLTPEAVSTTRDPAYLQLSVVTDDHHWVQALTQSGYGQLITINLIAVPVSTEWVEKTLQCIQRDQADGVLLDLEAAPTEQSMTLLTALSTRLDVPVLVVSGNDNFDHRVDVSSRGGRIFLLKATPADQVLEQVIQALPYFRPQDARILVVNSDRQTLSTIHDSLAPRGFQLKGLADSRQVWQTLVAFSPHLLIVDGDMSHLSGVELCRVVRADPVWRKLQILFLTSCADAATMQHLLTIGADDCIPKPITGTKLLTGVMNRLARAN